MQILGAIIIVVVLWVLKSVLSFLPTSTSDDSEQIQKTLQA